MKENDLAIELIKGCLKIIKNAQKLFISAVDIKELNPSLAYFIFQISMEEVAKIEIIGKELTGYYCLENCKINLDKIKNKLISHKEKNFENSYFQPLTEYEIKALKSKDCKKIKISHEKLKSEFHRERNHLKNLSLYTNFDGKNFIAPDEVITKERVEKIEIEASKYILMMFNKIDLLEYWKENPPAKNKFDTKKLILSLKAKMGIVKSVRRKNKKIYKKKSKNNII